MTATNTRTRRNGEGSTPKLRADGRYQVRYMDNVTGKPVSLYARTEADAIRMRTEALRRRDDGMRAVDRRLTVGGWLAAWTELRAAEDARPTTIAKYRTLSTRIAGDPIAKVKLHELRAEDVARLIVRLKADRLANGTIRAYVGILSAAVQLAVRQGDLARNVVAFVKLPAATPKTVVVPPTSDQVRAILAGSIGVDRYALAYALAAMAGLRQGEVLGLRYRDLDLAEGVVHVRENWTQSTGTKGQASHMGPTKSRRGVRSIAMADPLPAMIRQHIARDLDGVMPHPATFVFASPETGRPVSHRALLDGWHRAAKRAGMPRFRFHDLRHAFAVHCLDMGVQLDQVSAWLGHSGLAITAQTYGHRDRSRAVAPPPMSIAM